MLQPHSLLRCQRTQWESSFKTGVEVSTWDEYCIALRLQGAHNLCTEEDACRHVTRTEGASNHVYNNVTRHAGTQGEEEGEEQRRRGGEGKGAAPGLRRRSPAPTRSRPVVSGPAARRGRSPNRSGAHVSHPTATAPVPHPRYLCTARSMKHPIPALFSFTAHLLITDRRKITYSHSLQSFHSLTYYTFTAILL